MCTAIIAYKVHVNYPLILLSNRDEFYNRPTEQASFWKDAPHVLGGVDLEKGGTWLGVNKSGRLALLTNYRDFTKHIENPLSRGLLAKSFLVSNVDGETYLNELSQTASDYNPYNIVVGDLDQLYYYSNMFEKPRKLSPGIYGLSNGLLNDPWPKVSTAREAMNAYVHHINPDDTLDEETLFSILSSSMTYPLDMLPKTGIPDKLEVDLSSIFIDLDEYGTRMQTLIYVDNLNNVNFTERSRATNGQWKQRRFAFKLTK